jgi:tryptophanyl-tRNA synthetase
MSLRDGSKKMSKSDPSDMSRINMTDDADTILQKIKKATTDAHPVPESKEGLEGRAEVENLVGIYAAITDRAVEDILTEFGGKGFGIFKPALAETLASKLSPIAAEMRRLNADTAALDAILKDGAEKARAVAQPIMAEVRDVVGLWRA